MILFFMILSAAFCSLPLATDRGITASMVGDSAHTPTREASMDAPRTESGDKMVCFEAIRGLAAFAVLVSHFLLGFWPCIVFLEGLGWERVPWLGRFLARSIGRSLWNGHMAVSIFFVLSGFVLSLVYFRRGSAS